MKAGTVNYELKRSVENLGGIELELETVADLNRAIDTICEQEPPETALDLAPYFGVVWPSARALCEHLARMGTWLKGKTVLELGCGLGLPSIVAAKLGARVTACDFHPHVRQFLERNLALNNVQVDYREYDWRNAEQPLGTFDFVIASDVLYEAHYPEPLAKALNAHCGKHGHVILADPGRTYLQPFAKALEAEGFRGDLLTHGDVFLLVYQRK